MAATPPYSPSRILFGAAYYAEYHLEDRITTDLDLMKAAGFSVIRVGESVWSTWEPRDSEFDLDWLQPVLDGAHERGISVILGTPTYAVPPWLQTAYPEIAAEPHGRADAVGRAPGGRLLASGLPASTRSASSVRSSPAMPIIRP